MGKRGSYGGHNKLSYDVVKETCLVKGFMLLDTEYVNAKTKLNVECIQAGHKHSIRFSDIKHDVGCAVCSGKVKPTIEQVQQKFLDKGCTLISTTYTNAYTKLDYICKNGHPHSIKLNDFNNGYGCMTCYMLSKFGSTNSNWGGGTTYDDYCDVWKDKGYKADIRERDGHRCLNPYCKSKHPDRLQIHHVNYDKKDCHPKNLITVCNSCNAAANKDRDWHRDWYQAVLYRRYGYVYRINYE